MGNGYLTGMVIIRCISAATEALAAFWMWRGQRIELAVRINGFLGLVGPLVLTTTMLLGLAGLAATRVPLGKLLWIGGGIAMIVWGTGR